MAFLGRILLVQLIDANNTSVVTQTHSLKDREHTETKRDKQKPKEHGGKRERRASKYEQQERWKMSDQVREQCSWAEREWKQSGAVHKGWSSTYSYQWLCRKWHSIWRNDIWLFGAMSTRRLWLNKKKYTYVHYANPTNKLRIWSYYLRVISTPKC